VDLKTDGSQVIIINFLASKYSVKRLIPMGVTMFVVLIFQTTASPIVYDGPMFGFG